MLAVNPTSYRLVDFLKVFIKTNSVAPLILGDLVYTLISPLMFREVLLGISRPYLHRASSLLWLRLTSHNKPFPTAFICVCEISPVKVRTLSLHLSATYTLIDCSYSYWASVSSATLPSIPASYVISVSQIRGLPTASFRFRLTVDTLAFSYALTTIWSCSGLSLVRVRLCWAHTEKTRHMLWCLVWRDWWIP